MSRRREQRAERGDPTAPALARTNRKGVTYYLHEGVTKTGKPRCFFARSVGEGALTELPEGYEVDESIHGVVSVRRRREGDSKIPADDAALVTAELTRHPHLRHYVARVDRNAIVIDQPNVDLADLRETAERLAFLPGRVEAFMEERIRNAHFDPVFRFVRDGETYVVHRMTYRGDGGWSRPLA